VWNSEEERVGSTLSSPAHSSDDAEKPPRRIIGYYAGWTAKQKQFTPADIPADLLTHINYAFGLIGPDDRAMLFDATADIGSTDASAELGGNFLELKRLKERYPHLTTFISMGGWTGSGGFSDACATHEKRREFAASCIELYLTRWPGVFDGIDIDWEYPLCCGLPENGYRPEDRRNCTLLFVELRHQLDDLGQKTGRYHPLTAAIPAGRELPIKTFELRESAAVLDWINVMTYDISGSGRSGLTNFNAAFAASTDDPSPSDEQKYQNVVGTVSAFVEEGVPREQLVVGVPFYGRGFAGVPDVNNGLYQPFTETMSADYHTIIADYLPTWTRHWHPQAEVPWLHDAEGGRMLSYDDPESIEKKAAYVRAEGLGGVMLWELSDDDARSSLLRAIGTGLGT
jgi:chitinase